MTLSRSNPGRGRAVIDRNDDSPRIRVAAIGGHGIFLDVLLDALRASGVEAWRVDPGTPRAPRDPLRLRGADLVLLDVSAAGYSERSRTLIRRFALEGLLAIVLDPDARPVPGKLSVQAGALWAVNPWSAAIEDLIEVIRRAAAKQRTTEQQRRRARRAHQAWAEITLDDSSILTMRLHDDPGEDGEYQVRRRSQGDGAAPSGLTGGEQGRQS